MGLNVKLGQGGHGLEVYDEEGKYASEFSFQIGIAKDEELFLVFFVADLNPTPVGFRFFLWQGPFLKRFFLFVCRLVRFLFVIVLTVERAIPAQGDYAKRKQFARFFAAFFKNGRAEPHGKFVDFKSENFSRDIVPQFVNGYHRKQNDDGERHAANRFHHFSKRRQ